MIKRGKYGRTLSNDVKIIIIILALMCYLKEKIFCSMWKQWSMC